jgi:hypothetical protein
MIKLTFATFVLLITVATTVIDLQGASKKPDRDWKTGRVEAQAWAQQQVPLVATPGMAIGGTYGPPVVMGPSVVGPHSIPVVGFAIVGPDYTYLVAYRLAGFHRKQPNIALHGMVRYAVEKGKFYILDDDGQEFRLMILQKKLPEVPPAEESKTKL